MPARWIAGKLGPMNARGGQKPRDLDDWFDEPEPEPPRRPSRASVQVDPDAQTREQAATPTDDRLEPEPLRRRRRSLRSAPIPNPRMLVALGIAVAVLFVGLALGGVFSSGSNKGASKPLTTQTTPTTTQSATPAQPLLPAATVKLGDHGHAVKELQRALKSLGYTVGTIDGVFGASTQSALIAFQTAHHLTPDGVLGRATRAALLNALRPG
jgi:Putative peptidoglycan binding domain